MRMIGGCLLLAAAILAPQQSSSDFHARYGRSDIERFVVRPGITMTVEYGADRTPCDMIVEGFRPMRPTSMQADKILDRAEVEQILADIAPAKMRGAELGQLGGFSTGGAYAHGEDYENVKIERVSPHDCQSVATECDVRVYVTFKRQACKALTK